MGTQGMGEQVAGGQVTRLTYHWSYTVCVNVDGML